jgi:hypothetical protein
MEKKLSIIVLTVLFIMTTSLTHGEEKPVFHEYKRIYLGELDIGILSAHIGEYLNGMTNTGSPAQVRVSFYKDALENNFSEEELAEAEAAIGKKLPPPGRRVTINLQRGEGWFSPLDDIRFMIVIQSTLAHGGRHIVLKRYIKDLVDAKRMTLRGTISSLTMEFTVPLNCTLNNSSRIYLSFDHSEMLDPMKSTLGIFLNSRGLQTIRLDSTNAYGGSISRRLPGQTVRDYNRLTITAGQLLAVECTPPFDPSLWTSITEDSYLYLSYFQKNSKIDLVQFPYPFVDPLIPVPETIYFLYGEAIDDGLFSQYLELAYFFGERFDWRRGDVSLIESLDDWGNGPLVAVVHTDTDAARQWREMVPGMDLGKTGGEPPGLRLFQVRGKPVLLIYGKNTGEIKKAFTALLKPDPAKLLNSGGASIRELNESQAETPRFLLGKRKPRSITLRELGIDHFTLRASGPADQTLYIPLVCGTSIPEYEAYMEVDYSYSPQVDTGKSSVEIRANDISFAGIPLSLQEGVTMGTERLELPHHLIDGPFSLEFYGHFWPPDMDYCKYTPRDYPWFTIFNTSRLVIPRDVYLKMPDLKWFRLWGYPFTGNPDRGSIIFEYEEHREARDSALNLAFFLGRQAGNSFTRFDASPIQDKLDYDANVIRIFTDFANVENTVKNLEPLLKQELYDKILHDSSRDHTIRTRRTVGVYEELLLPGKERALLSIHAPDKGDLKRLVKTLDKNQSLQTFRGSAALIDSWEQDIYIKSFDSADREQWGELSVGRRTKHFFLRNIWLLIIAAPILIFLIYIIVRLFKHLLFKRKGKADKK